jgi:hypothetical protein
MRGIGKPTPWLAAALVFVCGPLLLPTQASAQFNIEGLIRGAMQHNCCYSSGYRHRSASAHHARGHSNDDAGGETSDKNKEKDASQVESNAGGSNPGGSNNPGHQQQPSGPAQAAARSVESDAPSKAAGGGNKTYDDQPAFSPSR